MTEESLVETLGFLFSSIDILLAIKTPPIMKESDIMTTGKIVVMFNEDYTLMDRIQWKLWHKECWHLTDVKWIKGADGISNIGYIATITGNRFIVKLLERHSERKCLNNFAKS